MRAPLLLVSTNQNAELGPRMGVMHFAIGESSVAIGSETGLRYVYVCLIRAGFNLLYRVKISFSSSSSLLSLIIT